MYRGTTPTLCLSLVTSLDLSKVDGVWVTFKSPCAEMTFTGEDVVVNDAERKLYVSMTQNDTLSFGTGKVKVQARLLMEDGKAFATDVEEVPVEAILMEGVLRHDPDEDIGDTGGPDEGPGDGGSGEDVGG